MIRKFFRVMGLQKSCLHAVSEWIRMSHAEQGYDCHYDNFVPMYLPNNIAKFLPPKAADLNEPFLWMVGHEDENFVDMPVLNSKLHENFEFHDVLIIRDVFNTFASRKKIDARKLFNRRFVQLWKQYAVEALGLTSFMGPNRLVIKFNEWHQDMEARKKIASVIGIEGVGADTSKMAAAPGFSSFDPNGTLAKDMQLMDRWKFFVNDKDYWVVFDKQAYDLNTSLFGANEEIHSHVH